MPNFLVSRAGRSCAMALACLAGLAAPSLPLAADPNAPALAKDQVGERIVIAGRQRMLAEGMAAKLCYAETGVKREKSQNDLYVMWNVFSWYHRGIMRGNRELRLAPELNTKVFTTWRDVDRLWVELSEIYLPVLSGQSVPPEAFQRAMAMTTDTAEQATRLVASLRAAYSSELGPRGFGTALLIDLYERQRMLGMRLSKDVCLLSRGDASEARAEELKATLNVFSASLSAFRNGLSEMGVPKPPTPQIAEDLTTAHAHWQTVEAYAVGATEGVPLSQSELTTFSHAMDRFLSEMTAAINELVAHQRVREG